MCWKVREGSYPPPPENTDGQQGFLAAARTYAKECFGHRFYWYFYLANACVAITWTTGAYGFLMARSYGLDAAGYGKFVGILGVVSTLLLYPAGALADKHHPLRVLLGSSIGIVCTQPLWFLFFLFDFSAQGAMILYMVVASITAVANAIHAAAELPMFMRLLPVDRYGQYSSANSLVRSFGVMASGVGCGLFIDFMKRGFPEPDFCYRFVPLWTAFFYVGSVVFLILLLYRECQRSGWGNHQRT